MFAFVKHETQRKELSSKVHDGEDDAEDFEMHPAEKRNKEEDSARSACLKLIFGSSLVKKGRKGIDFPVIKLL